MAKIDVNRLASWVKKARLTLMELSPGEDPVDYLQYRILCELPNGDAFFMNDCKTGTWIYRNEEEARTDYDRIIEWQQMKPH